MTEQSPPQPASPPSDEAPETRPGGADGRPAPRRGRKWAFRLIASVGMPLLLVGLLEGALAVFGYGVATDFFQPIESAETVTSNPRFGWRFFPPAVARAPEPVHLTARKRPNTCRIFLLGGSAAAGVPDSAFGIGRVLEAMLELKYPEGTFEVVNTAMVAVNSHVVRAVAAECADRQPDLFVVYLGHNEVIGPYGPATVFAGFSPSRSMVRLSMWVRTTHTGQLFGSLLGGGQADRFTSWRGMEMFADNRVAADDPRMAGVYEHFADNLADICRAARDAGARAIVCTVATNLADCPPLASLHRADLPADQAAAWKKLFDGGCRSQQVSRHAAAIDQFVEAAKIDDRHAELHFRLAGCYRAVGRTDEARKHFVRARDADALRFRADTRINDTVRQLAGQAELGAYLVDAERAVAEDPRVRDGIPGGELLFEHVHLNFEGNYAVAKAIFRTIVRHKLFGGSGHVRSEPTDEPPSPPRCAKRLGLTAWHRRRMLAHIVQMTRRPPFTSQLGHKDDRARRAAELADAGKALTPAVMADAVEACRQAIEKQPDDLVLRHSTAHLLLAAQDNAAAAEHWRFILQHLPHCNRAHTGLGMALTRLGRFDEAMAHFARALKDAPNEPALLTNLGITHLARGQLDQAAEHLKAALAARGDYAPAVKAMGQLHARKGRFDQALEQYSEAARIDPDDAEVFKGLADLCLGMKRSDEAMAHYRRCLALRPDAGAHGSLGSLLMGKGDAAGAAEQFRKALQLRPGRPTAHANLAAALLSLKQAKEAVAELTKAIALDANHPLANSMLGWLMVRAGRAEAGLPHLQRAAKAAPDDVANRLRLGNALSLLGQPDRAVPHYRAVLAAQPHHAAARQNLGAALANLGQVGEAIKHLSAAGATNPNPELLRLLAELLTRRGRDREAVEQYRKALRMKPSWPPAIEGLAWTMATSSDPAVHDGAKAVELAMQACTAAKYRSAGALDALAAALADQGRYDQAVVAAGKALTLARQANNPALADQIVRRISYYEAGKPFRRNSRPATVPAVP